MKGFAGFPEGKLRTTPVPNLFFSDLLPIIDDLAELKITLYAFWALNQMEGAVRFLRLADFITDPVLLAALHPDPTTAARLTGDALERAVARGTFLHVNVESDDGRLDLYFPNTEKGRAAVEGITRGEWRPSMYEDASVTLLIERPNIFVLYEQNIGPLTPLIADQLRDAEQTYPTTWIKEAIELAVESNVRKWRYILAILERWRQEGKQDGVGFGDSQKKLSQQIPDEYRDIVKR